MCCVRLVCIRVQSVGLILREWVELILCPTLRIRFRPLEALKHKIINMKLSGGLLMYALITMLYIGELAAQDKKPMPKVHCLGITKKGDSCRAKPKDDSKYCMWHDPKAIRCAKDGCKMIVTRKGDYCIYHMK
jgi:hypothetical protein